MVLLHLQNELSSHGIPQGLCYIKVQQNSLFSQLHQPGEGIRQQNAFSEDNLIAYGIK